MKAFSILIKESWCKFFNKFNQRLMSRENIEGIWHFFLLDLLNHKDVFGEFFYFGEAYFFKFLLILFDDFGNSLISVDNFSPFQFIRLRIWLILSFRTYQVHQPMIIVACILPLLSLFIWFYFNVEIFIFEELPGANIPGPKRITGLRP